MLDLNQLFSFARKAQGIKQGALARKVGIAQPSLSQFENGQATLSRKTLHTMAPLLNINPEYIDCESENPFRSSGLIRMFFYETSLNGIDYSSLECIVKMNPSVEIIFLNAISRVKTNNWMTSRTIIDRFTQAILMRDQDSNVFLLLRKRKGFYLAEEPDLRVRILEIAKAENKNITFQTQKISQGLFLKIENWTVERGDVEDFFIQRRTRLLSLDEDRLIEEVRVGGYNVSDLLAHLEEIMAGAYDMNDLLGMSRVVQAVKACGRGNI